MIRQPPRSTLFPTRRSSDLLLWEAADLVDEYIGDEPVAPVAPRIAVRAARSEEHTSELQSRPHLVCRLLLEKKNKGTVAQIGNTGKTTGSGTQEEVTNFEVKIRIEDHDVELKPALSCTADIHTNEVKDVVAVPMQAVTIRTGESNLSPEEIEKKRQKVTQRDKGDNNAEFVNERAEKAAQKEEREKLVKG